MSVIQQSWAIVLQHAFYMPKHHGLQPRGLQNRDISTPTEQPSDDVIFGLRQPNCSSPTEGEPYVTFDPAIATGARAITSTKSAKLFRDDAFPSSTIHTFVGASAYLGETLHGTLRRR
jgi:hypothetical protein